MDRKFKNGDRVFVARKNSERIVARSFGYGTVVGYSAEDHLWTVQIDGMIGTDSFPESYLSHDEARTACPTNWTRPVATEDTKHDDTSVASAKVGDLYVDDEGGIYRVTRRIDEPVIEMLPVEERTPGLVCLRFPKFASVSNEEWDGFKRIYRPRVKSTGEK